MEKRSLTSSPFNAEQKHKTINTYYWNINMKVSSLLENITPASAPNQEGSQAPKFGRDPNVLEDDDKKLDETTTSGSVATVAQPVGGVQRRGKGSIFQGVKTSKKFPNSAPVKEDITEGVNNTEKEVVSFGKYDFKLWKSYAEQEGYEIREAGNLPGSYAAYDDGKRVGYYMNEFDLPNDHQGIVGKLLVSLAPEEGMTEGTEQGIWIVKYWDRQPGNDSAQREFTSKPAADKFAQTLPRHYAVAVRPQSKDTRPDMGESVAEGNDPKKDVEAIRSAIARMERELADPNPHIDREKLLQRIAWEKRRLNLYRDVEGVSEDFGGGGHPATPKYKVGDSVYVRNYQGIGKIAYIKHRGDVGVMFKEPSHPRVVTTIDDLKPAHSVAEGLSDTQKKIEDTILKLEQRLKFAKTPEQWDNIKDRIERLQAGLDRSKQGVAEGFDEDDESPYHVRILDRQTKKILADEEIGDWENDAVDRAEAYLAWAKTKGMDIVAQVYQPAYGKNYVTWQVPDGNYDLKEQGVAEEASEKGRWRVERAGDGFGERYYVVRGYSNTGGRWAEMWKNSYGAGDFTSKQQAEQKADQLNTQGVTESPDKQEYTVTVNGITVKDDSTKETKVFASKQEAETEASKIKADRIKKDLPANSVEVKEKNAVTEDAIREEQLLARELKKSLALFKKGEDKELGNKPSDKDISNKPEDKELSKKEEIDENLRKWFKEKWVRFGPDGKIRGSCARGDDSEGKPKCLPQSKAHSLGNKGRKYAANKKRREDPNPERSGKAINVATKKKSNESEQLDEKCWPGYKKDGMKKMFGKTYPNCVKKEDVQEEKCPHCNGPMFSELMINEKKDACYYKVKSRYKVWPSAYASGALVQCRKKGADSWGKDKSK
jgi:hypothetical protein